MRNSAHRWNRESFSPPARGTRLIRQSMKATPRHKSLDFQVCRSDRIRQSTSANARAAPSPRAPLDFFGDAPPAFALPRLPLDRRSDAPLKSRGGGLLDTARNLSSTTSLSRPLLQSVADIPSIHDRQ